MANYQIKRDGVDLVSVSPSGKQSKKIMDVNLVEMTFNLTDFVDIRIGDKVEVYGEVYTLQEMPTVEKVSKHQWNYSVQFKGRSYELGKISYLQYDANNVLSETDFSVMGNIDTFIDLLVENANRLNGGGWSKGTIDVSEFQNITFSANNCLSVLSVLAEKYKTEWWVDNQTIHMTQKGENQDITLEYGKGNGLYSIKRESQSSKNIFNRLYVYGSSENIPASYRNYSSRLKIPAPAFYIESADSIAKYGVIENVEIFDTIKPQYRGVISSVTDKFHFRDATIDFDVNSSKIPNLQPKALFLTGQLSGYSFEVNSFDNTLKEFRINTNQNEKALILPSENLKPGIGDVFTLIDLSMNPAYITDAENRLLIEGQSFLDKNDNPVVVYSVNADPLNLKKRNIQVLIGNRIKIKDEEFELEDFIRILALTRDLQNEWLYTFDLQESISISQIVRSYSTTRDIKSAIVYNRLKDVNRARQNYKTTAELRNLIYDPEGNYFNPANIKPLSIETLMLSVGAKSQQFTLSGILFQYNYEGDKTRFYHSSGNLEHFSIGNGATPYTWVVSTPTEKNGLEDSKSYFIYIKCSKTDNSATVELSNTPVLTEDIPGYYYFLVGVLSSVIDGVRGMALTYGESTINGRFITTGLVQSRDGITGFDLDNGIIFGKIMFLAGSAGYENLLDKPDLSDFTTTGELADVSAVADAAAQAAYQAALDAYNANLNAVNAMNTAIAVQELTSFLQTTIDGNVVATGTLLVGDATEGNAGITGVTDNGEESIRFFAGAPYADKDTAPWYVRDDGYMRATKGQIANFKIDEKGLYNDQDLDAYIIQQKKNTLGVVIAKASIGTAVSSGDNRVGDFVNHIDNSPFSVPNYGLRVSVKNGSNVGLNAAFTGNNALHAEGDIHISLGNLVVDGKCFFRENKLYFQGTYPVTETKAGFGAVMRNNDNGELTLYYE